jgi:hypothetical protein
MSLKPGEMGPPEFVRHTEEQVEALREIPLAFETKTFAMPWTEREIAAELGVDYDAVLAHREAVKQMPQEMQDALAEVRRETQRRILGL